MPVSLSLQEAALLNALAGLLADEPLIEMDSLRVRVGSQGFELGRTYLALRSHDLVAEHHSRPGFFRRLFGAKPKRYVSLTDAGRALATGQTAPTTEAPALLRSDLQPPAPSDAPQAAAPRASTRPKAASLPKADPAQSRKKRTPPPAGSDFTETLGGAPLEAPAATDDPVRLEGLAEMLGLIGFEITPAGQLLAGRRWTEGRRDSEVALEILLVAVAHAARLDTQGMAHLDRATARLFFAEVEKEFAQLAAAGELSADYLSQTLATVEAILGTPDEAEALLAAIIADPLLGAAPPAICPDDFYQPTDNAKDLQPD